MAAKKTSAKKATTKRSRASAKQATSRAKATANAPAPAKKAAAKKAAPRSRSGANVRPPAEAASSIEALQEKGWLEKPKAGMGENLPKKVAASSSGISAAQADIEGRGGRVSAAAAESGKLFTPKAGRGRGRRGKAVEETTPEQRMQTASEMVEGLPEASTRPTQPGEKAIKAKTVPARGAKTKREAASVLLGKTKSDRKSKGRKPSTEDLERATDRIDALVKSGMPYSEAARHRSVIRDLAGGWRDDMGRAKNKAVPTGGRVENADLTAGQVRAKEEAKLRKLDSRDRFRLPEAEGIEQSGGEADFSPKPHISVTDLLKAHGADSAESIHAEALATPKDFRQLRGRHIRESVVHHLSQAQLHKKTKGRAGTKLTASQINGLQNIYENANMVYGATDRTRAVSFCSHTTGKGKNASRSCPNLVFGSEDDKCEQHGGRPAEEQRATAERESRVARTREEAKPRFPTVQRGRTTVRTPALGRTDALTVGMEEARR